MHGLIAQFKRSTCTISCGIFNILALHKSPITAKIELDTRDKKSITKRAPVIVKRSDDLYDKSGGRDLYENYIIYIINEIYCEAGNEYVSFTSMPDILSIGKAVGDIDALAIKEQQIREN
jgi:type III restriction enzyme